MSVPNGGFPGDDTNTIFTTLMPPFPNPQEGNKIDTRGFLDASRGVVALVDKLGKVFAPVSYDMNGNIDKISKKYEEDKLRFGCLEDMVLAEHGDGQNTSTDALQWLRRGLHFMMRFFEGILNDPDNTTCLSIYMKKAYTKTLEQYHGWMGSQLFNIMCRFAPTRESLFFMLALERADSNEIVLRDMRHFVEKLSVCVDHLTNFYKEHNLETHIRV